MDCIIAQMFVRLMCDGFDGMKSFDDFFCEFNQEFYLYYIIYAFS